MHTNTQRDAHNTPEQSEECFIGYFDCWCHAYRNKEDLNTEGTHSSQEQAFFQICSKMPAFVKEEFAYEYFSHFCPTICAFSPEILAFCITIIWKYEYVCLAISQTLRCVLHTLSHLILTTTYKLILVFPPNFRFKNNRSREVK